MHHFHASSKIYYIYNTILNPIKYVKGKSVLIHLILVKMTNVVHTLHSIKTKDMSSIISHAKGVFPDLTVNQIVRKI